MNKAEYMAESRPCDKCEAKGDNPRLCESCLARRADLIGGLPATYSHEKACENCGAPAHEVKNGNCRYCGTPRETFAVASHLAKQIISFAANLRHGHLNACALSGELNLAPGKPVFG